MNSLDSTRGFRHACTGKNGALDDEEGYMGALELLWLIAAGSPEHLRASRRGMMWATLAVKGVVFVIFATYFVYSLLSAQQTGEFAPYDRVFLILLAVLFVFALIPLPFNRGRGQMRRADEAARLLRRAASSGDDRLAPLGAGESASGGTPQAVDAENEAALGPLRGLDGAPRTALSAAANIGIPLVVGLGWIEVSLDFTNRDLFLSPPQILVFGIVFMVLLAALYVGIYWDGTRPEAIFVEVDAAGLRWTEAGTMHQLAWSEAQAFFRVSFAGINPQRSRTAFVLDGGVAAALVWTLTPTTRADQRAAAAQMEGLVAGRTALPLRDLTELAGTLTLTGASLVRLRALGIPTEALAEAGQPGA